MGTGWEKQKRALYYKEHQWSVAVYIRLSREDGGGVSESVVNQKKILEEYLSEYFGEPYHVWDYYIDDGLSGTDDTRKEFMRMIGDIEENRVDCVLCKTLARAFRNYADQGYYLEYYFPQRGVRFITTGDPKVDTLKNPEGVMGLEVPITGLMNDRYAGKTSADVRRTFNTKRRQGEFIGAFAPYGYVKDPKDKNHLLLDKEIAVIKRQMKDWIVEEGLSLNAVAEKMNLLGIPNPTAYKQEQGLKYKNPNSGINDGLWSGVTVKQVLLNPANLGHMVQGRQRVVSYKVHDRISVPPEEWFIVEDTHEPTFTQQEFEALEKLIRRRGKQVLGTRQMHTLSGFIRCADCKKGMQRKSSKGYVYYSCTTYSKKGRAECRKHSIREDAVKKAILKALWSRLLWYPDMEQIWKKVNSGSGKEMDYITNLAKNKQTALKQLNRAEESLYIDWKNGDITREEYKEMKCSFNEKIEKLCREIDNLKLSNHLEKKDLYPDWRALFQEVERLIMIQFIDMVYVGENQTVSVEMKFREPEIS